MHLAPSEDEGRLERAVERARGERERVLRQCRFCEQRFVPGRMHSADICQECAGVVSLASSADRLIPATWTLLTNRLSTVFSPPASPGTECPFRSFQAALSHCEADQQR